MPLRKIRATLPLMIDLDALPDKLKAIRWEIRAQYLEEDGARPWVIGFSGGKDSTRLVWL